MSIHTSGTTLGVAQPVMIKSELSYSGFGVRSRKEVHLGDRYFFWIVRAVGLLVLSLPVLMGLFLLDASLLSLEKSGWSFLTSSTWDAVRDHYGALPVVYGTLVSSFLALLIAGPLSIAIALFINELLPRSWGGKVATLIEMLAAIPSVVYGLWGVFVLAPWLREVVQPFLTLHFGFLPLFQGPAYGVGMLTSGIILSVMIIPTISSISRELFNAVPGNLREAALALGSTRWEMMKIAVLKSSKAGLFGALILGLGRALGETMAVTMVIGNRAEISASLFAPAQTMASLIANEYAEAASDIHLSALAEVGLLLFAVTFLVNGLARFLLWRYVRVREQH